MTLSIDGGHVPVRQYEGRSFEILDAEHDLLPVIVADLVQRKMVVWSTPRHDPVAVARDHGS